MSEEEKITITNPPEFMIKSFLSNKLESLGYCSDSVSINIITKNQVPWEIELHFCMKELADKFFTRQNGKSFPPYLNYHLELKKGSSDKKSIIIPETKEFIFPENCSKWLEVNFEIRKNVSGVVLIKQTEIENQKRVMNFIIKKIGNNVIKGQSLMNLSLPVYIFDKRSMLQVFVYELQESPYTLSRVFYTKDKIEKLKFMTVYLISQMYHSTLLLKPFNPIIGETLQIKIGNLNCYLEQTVHKPPTANIYCFDDEKKYKIYGYIATTAQTGANSAKGKKVGKMFIEFNDGQKYQIYYPDIYCDGILMGTKTFNYKHCGLIIDLNNNICSFIKMNPDQKSFISGIFSKKKEDFFPCKFIGKIVNLSDVKIDEKGAKHELNKDAKGFGEITGEWTKDLKFDNVLYWKRNLKNLLKFYEPEFKLKSDSTFREDMQMWISTNDEKASQVKKEEMEELQRKDAKLRKEYEKKK